MKNSPLLFVLIFILILSLIFSLASWSEFYEVGILKNVENYPFGAEGPVAELWHYESAKNYTIYNLVLGILWTFVSVLSLISIFNKNLKYSKSLIIFAFIVYIFGRILENL